MKRETNKNEMKSLYRKELYPGQRLVSPKISKLLKELGWKWPTHVILKVKTDEVVIPIKEIDCNVGDAYRFLPTLQQVVHWLDHWGITIKYEIISVGGVICYTNLKIITEMHEAGIKINIDSEIYWEDLIESGLEKILDIFKNNLLRETLGYEEWIMEKYYRKVLAQNAIVHTSIYDHLLKNPKEL